MVLNSRQHSVAKPLSSFHRAVQHAYVVDGATRPLVAGGDRQHEVNEPGGLACSRRAPDHDDGAQMEQPFYDPLQTLPPLQVMQTVGLVSLYTRRNGLERRGPTKLITARG